MNNEDYPALYRSADKNTKNAKRLYFTIIILSLAVLTLGTFLDSIDFNDFTEPNKANKYPYIVSSFLFAISIVLSILIAFSKYDRNWYNGRAISESIKSMTWRFMIGGEPYLLSYSNEEVSRFFVRDLKRIIKEHKEFKELISHDSSNGSQISNKMLAYRQLNYSERLEYYIQYRIKEQRKWYRDKSALNAKYMNWFIGFIILLQIAALLTSIMSASNGKQSINFTSIFASCSMALIAWIKSKQYQEISQSYAITAHEIGFIEEEAKLINEENALAKFIGDAENAFSREHTLWLARKDNLNY